MLRLDVQAPAGVLQVGRDGGVRVLPRPARPPAVPAGYGSHRLRGHPAQPRAPSAPPGRAAGCGRGHGPRDEQRHLDDIFWVHLAYSSAPDGIERLHALLGTDRHYAALLAGFEAIDRGRRVLEDRTSSAEARRAAEDLIWEGNVQLLEHEQRAVVQPNFDRLSGAYAGLFSMGSTLNFEVRGLRREVSYFTSFYLYAVPRRLPQAVRSRTWPRITRFDDRWPWIVTSILPRFRKFDANAPLVDASLRRILADARAYASHACVSPSVGS